MIFVVSVVCLIGASFVMLLLSLVLDRLHGPAESVPASFDSSRETRPTWEVPAWRAGAAPRAGACGDWVEVR